MTKLETLIAEFAQRRGLAGLSADENGRYALTVDGELHLECFENFGLIHLIAELDELAPPESRLDEQLRPLLNYALRRMKRSRATPTLDENNRLLLFERFAAENAGIYDFEERLEGYLNALEAYRQVMRQRKPVAASLQPEMIFRP